MVKKPNAPKVKAGQKTPLLLFPSGSWKRFGHLDFCDHLPGVRDRYKAQNRMQERQTAELNNAFHHYRQKYSGIWEIQ